MKRTLETVSQTLLTHYADDVKAVRNRTFGLSKDMIQSEEVHAV